MYAITNYLTHQNFGELWGISKSICLFQTSVLPHDRRVYFSNRSSFELLPLAFTITNNLVDSGHTINQAKSFEIVFAARRS